MATNSTPFSDSHVIDLETFPIDEYREFIEAPSAPSNYKDPEKIAAYVQEGEQKRIAMAALDLDLARIVAVGVLPYLGPEATYRPEDVTVDLFETAADEGAALERLRPILEASRVITFNGQAYDLALLQRRFYYHRLPPLKIDMDRYRTQNLDLYAKLTNYDNHKAHKLAWYVRRLGWTDLMQQDLITGAEIGQLVREAQWNVISGKVQRDVAGTARLAAWMGVTQP